MRINKSYVTRLMKPTTHKRLQSSTTRLPAFIERWYQELQEDPQPEGNCLIYTGYLNEHGYAFNSIANYARYAASTNRSTSVPKKLQSPSDRKEGHFVAR